MANDVFIDTKQINKLTIELKGLENEMAEATYHALNRTLDHVVTQVGRIVPKSYAVKSKEVKESFKGGIKRPSKGKLEASLTSKGRTLSFAHFPYTPKSPRKSKGSIFKNVVMVTIKKSKGKIISRKGFVATTGAKSAEKTQYNVFKRLGDKRLPIAPIRTLSIPQMISNEGITEEIQKTANEKLAERIEHEIIYRITSIGDKIRK